nr:DUF1624 domain-containing protein [Desulfobulbaceae bacterium]
MVALQKNRVWEIDCLRGVAVCLMLISNFLFDLYYFYSLGNPESGFLAYFSRAVAGLFLFVVGVSLTLSVNKTTVLPSKKIWLRSAKLLVVAMGISLATYVAVGQDFVVFGILHLISVSIVLGYFFLGCPWLSLIVGISVLSLAPYLGVAQEGSWWLVWFGIPPVGFHSVDYTPLIPWFGPVLIGIFVGKMVYRQGETLFKGRGDRHGFILKTLGLLGKNSLVIYCLHQPILWGGFVAFGML